MNKNIIVGIVVGAVIFAGIVWIARPDGKDAGATVLQNSNGVLNAKEQSFDFGSISMAAGKVTHRFAVKNTGADPVNISKMYTSCMCTTSILQKGGKKFGPYGMPGHGFVPKMNAVIDPGEEVSVDVTFDPAAHGPAGVGKIDRVVILENNAGENIELQISANVTP
ncbi:MAG: DUF1573 domain-containing protein [Candidatus Wildermuthbacteria bacterium]|nr:DUF1573 domain-containing protein [Candidatus Wildermuthbacteria bacterium]